METRIAHGRDDDGDGRYCECAIDHQSGSAVNGGEATSTTMRTDIPKECVNLTGTAMSDCVRDHNPSSMRSKSGTNGATTNSMRNDESGGGTTGGGNAGNSGTSGSAGASGSGTGGAASGGTGGDNGNGTGGGNGK